MINIESFLDDYNNSITYLIYDENYCIVIDPANSINIIKRYIGNRKLLGIFITHGHYDHFKELINLLNEYNVCIYMSKLDYEKLNYPHMNGSLLFGISCGIDVSNYNIHFLNDNEHLELQNFKLKVMFTPGHTIGSISLLIDNYLFSGDLLFKDSIGRYDLPTGSYTAIRSSLDKIKNLDNKIIVYSGHDEPFTIEECLKNNRYLQ